MMKIHFINNDGGGFADTLEVEPGTTVGSFFAKKMGDVDPANYHIRVNRQPVTRDQALVEGDRISFTPAKVAGAC
jgi:hypothetical protein